jgi:hypothetical protein
LNPAVFVSRPGVLTRRQRSTFRSWCRALARRGLELRTLSRDEYGRDPWTLLRERLRAVQGAAVFGFRQIDISRGVLCSGTDEQRAAPHALASPWTQIEAGLAISSDLPVLALAERGISEGVFDPTTWGTQVIGGDLTDVPTPRALDAFLTAVRLQELPGIRVAAPPRLTLWRPTAAEAAAGGRVEMRPTMCPCGWAAQL